MTDDYESSKKVRRYIKLKKQKRPFTIALLAGLLISGILFYALESAFSKDLPVETVPYDREKVQAGDHIEGNVVGYLTLFREEKRMQAVALSQKYYGIAFLDDGSSFLADTEEENLKGSYYGTVREYDDNVTEVMNNPDFHFTMDVSSLDLESMQKVQNGEMTITEMLEQGNSLYEMRDALLPLMGEYQISLSKNAPTRTDPRRSLANIPFWIGVLLLVLYFLYRVYLRKLDHEIIVIPGSDPKKGEPM